MIKRKHLLITFGLLSLAILFTSSMPFSYIPSPPRGNIEGYVFPKKANPFVEVAVPHPQIPGDTIYRKAMPNANGYYKILSIPVGEYELVYRPRNHNYKSKSKPVSVAALATTNAGTVTLELQ